MKTPTAVRMLQNKNYWLFDMDGTLTCAMHDFDAMRAELGLPAGVPILEALAALDEEEAKAKRKALDAMELRMAADAKPQPGSHELLTKLQARGAHLGIVTRNGRQIADTTLQACCLSNFFHPQTIISRDCSEVKPHPAGVQLLLQRWSAPAAEAVMVGDYLYDLAAGHAAGIDTVHLATDGNFAWPEMTSLGVRSLVELRGWV